MNILLTNDDGYNSEGIQALYKALSKEHNVMLSAPLTQKSSTGHGLTLFTPMKLKNVPGGYAVNGTPADCVKVALCGLFKDTKFDLVVSGINHGSNMGCDIFYSGTVAAAREGLLNGIPGVACSMETNGEKQNYDSGADFICCLIEKLSGNILKKQIILNVNFPAKANYNKIKITHLGKRVYNDTIHFEEKDGVKYASIVGNSLSFLHSEGSDLNCVSEGVVSITPLSNEYFVPKIVGELTQFAAGFNAELLNNGRA